MNAALDGLLTPELRQFILRMANNYRAPDPEDIAQIVMLDITTKPFLAESKNQGALVQRIRHRTLTQFRTAARRDFYEGKHARLEYPELVDGTEEASDMGLDGWEGSDWE